MSIESIKHSADRQQPRQDSLLRKGARLAFWGVAASGAIVGTNKAIDLGVNAAVSYVNSDLNDESDCDEPIVATVLPDGTAESVGPVQLDVTITTGDIDIGDPTNPEIMTPEQEENLADLFAAAEAVQPSC